MSIADARALTHPCPRLYARWLSSPERGAWITRGTRLIPPTGPHRSRALDPRASHVPPMWAVLVGRLGPNVDRWSCRQIREGVGGYLARHGAAAVIEIAQWWRFMARIRRRPGWARLAVCIEIDRWTTR